jgi:hypothetical protein
MTAKSLHLRIGRIVVDSPLAAGMTAEALADAIRTELAARLPGGPAAPVAARPPLAGLIAEHIAGRLGTATAGIAAASGGGADGSR